MSAAVTVEAGHHRSYHRGGGGGGDGVIATSRFGNGSVGGAVRGTSVGPQVQLPSGSWIYCRRSCSETLRVETIDFWENDGRLVGAGTASNECGVFGCLGTRFRY